MKAQARFLPIGSGEGYGNIYTIIDAKPSKISIMKKAKRFQGPSLGSEQIWWETE